MKPSTIRILRIALAAVIIGFIATAGYTSLLVFQRQAALRDVGRGNVNWVVAQGPSEFARLQQRIAEYELPGSPVDAAEVKLRLDIMMNRLKTFKSEDIGRFINSSQRNIDTVAELEDVLGQVRQQLGSLSDPQTALHLLALMEPIYPKLARLSTDANVWNSQRLADDRDSLFRLQWVFIGVAGGLILCGIIFTGLLLLHNRLLKRTQDQLHHQDIALQTQNDRFNAALNNMSQGLCLLDAERRLIVYNKRFLELLQLDPDRVAPGTALADIVSADLLPQSLDMAAPDGEEDGDGEGAPAAQGERILRLDGMVLAVTHAPMVGGGWVSTFEDVTERQRTQDHIVHMAHHDALTGMPNRLLFWKSAQQATRRLHNTGQPFAVLYLDLDRFKEVNDSLGHPVGDALLRQVAESLRSVVAAPDIVARLGGDEFAVLHRLADDSLASTEDLAARLLQAINRRYLIDGNEIVVSTSIGIAVAPKDGRETDELMKNADLALYRAKAQGSSTYHFFAPEIEAALQLRRKLEADLRRGIEQGQFELYFQPLVSLGDWRVVSGEALLRWRHPERGMISPGEFIPLAEETGLIDALGEWTLRRALGQARQWPDHVRVSVNLSPVQFREQALSEMIGNLLAESGLPAERLELEITESVLLQNNASNLDALHRLRALGVRIALDDFGTGYSSLSYLQRFPFDKLKIDQSFVRDLEKRPESAAIVQSITDLGRTLKMVTTAEGVETRAQLDMVTAAGCTEAQGYYFSRPVPEAEFRALLEREYLGVDAIP